MAGRPDPGATAARDQHARVDRPLLTLSGVIVIGAFGSALDATVVFVALDSIGQEFGGSLPSLQWVALGYLLALAIVVPITGWSVERFGARTMWLGALSLFTVGAALCGMAWSVESLITFRVLQGLGGGLIPPLAQIILVRAAGPARIGRVMSMVSVPTQLAPIVGPTIGGFLVAGLGWRFAFYLYLPLGVLGVLLAWRHLPNEPRRSAPRLDLVGLLLLSPGVVMLIYGFTMAGGDGVGLPISGTLVVVVVGAVLLAGYAVHALRRGDGAAIDLRLFQRRPFAVATGLLFLSGASLFGLMFLLPLYYQQVRGSDPVQAGLLLAPQGIGMVAALLVAGVLVDRYGPRRIVLVGILITIAGTMPFTQVSTVDDDLLLTVALLIRGFGLGAAAIPLTAAAYRSLPEEEIPRAASALVVAQRLGASLGTAVLAVVLHRALGAEAQEVAPIPAMQAAAFEHAFWWTVVLSVGALAMAWLLPGRARTATRGPDRSARFSVTIARMTRKTQPAGRRADAARNDVRILAAARDVFVELGADAPVSTIAERAGVGMGTLYRRFPSKEDLVRALSMASMSDTRRAAEEALTHPDPWQAVGDFVDACVDAGVDGLPRVTPPFEVTEELLRESRRAREAVQRLVDRAQASGVLRDDVNAHDIVLLLHVLRELRVAHRQRNPALRRRFQAVVLDGLRPAAAHPLPEPPATWEDVVTAWRVTAGADSHSADSEGRVPMTGDD